MRSWKNYTGKDVVINARGTIYRGRLVEMTETSILLRAPEGFREIQMDGVTSMELSTGIEKKLMGPSPLAGL